MTHREKQRQRQTQRELARQGQRRHGGTEIKKETETQRQPREANRER